MINGETVEETDQYGGYYQKTDTNIILMNHDSGDKPWHGAVTDLQVWSRRLSVQETRSWALCRDQQEGDLVSWQEVKLEIKGLNVTRIERRETCLEEPVRGRYVGFDLKMTFFETKKFCENMGGSILVFIEKNLKVSGGTL